MKKALKIIMVGIMLLGIAFSILNFISVELCAKDVGMRGIMINGECQYIGTRCLIREAS